jgi:hypothetical protein
MGSNGFGAEDVIHEQEEDLWAEMPAVERLRAGSRGLEEHQIRSADRRLKPP